MTDLLAMFLLEEHRYVQIVGGGGKTTLMLRMAAALRARTRPVLVGTTTHIRAPAGCPSLVLSADAPTRARDASRALTHWGWACVASGVEDGTGKLLGLTPQDADALHAALPEAWLLLEADGSRGLPVKAHAEHEPMLTPQVQLVVAVLGLEALGRPLDARTVHRPELLAATLGVPLGIPLTCGHLARAATALLTRASPRAARLVFLSQACPEREGAARDLAGLILARDHGIGRVVWGDLLRSEHTLAWADDIGPRR